VWWWWWWEVALSVGFRGVFGGSAPQGAGWLVGHRLLPRASHAPRAERGAGSVQPGVVELRGFDGVGFLAFMPGEGGLLAAVARVVPVHAAGKHQVA